MRFDLFEELPAALYAGIAGSVPSSLLGIAAYVLSSLALYTIAQRRGLRHPWLSWIPLTRQWLLGSVSDQYRYLTRGENRSKRKLLLILAILKDVLSCAMLVLFFSVLFQLLAAATSFRNQPLGDMFHGPAVATVGILVPFVGVKIAFTIIRFMALYDTYKSLDPGNSVVYLVLSILIPITEPFFLFFNREKELGMPPRKASSREQHWQPQPEYRCPDWQQEGEESAQQEPPYDEYRAPQPEWQTPSEPEDPMQN